MLPIFADVRPEPSRESERATIDPEFMRVRLHMAGALLQLVVRVPKLVQFFFSCITLMFQLRTRMSAS